METVLSPKKCGIKLFTMAIHRLKNNPMTNSESKSKKRQFTISLLSLNLT